MQRLADSDDQLPATTAPAVAGRLAILWQNKLLRSILPFVVVALFSLPAGLPLFHEGYYWTHDGNHHIRRLMAFDEAFHAGQFPVRYLRNWGGDYMEMPERGKPAIGGYGGPIFISQYPLPYYLGETMHLLGFNMLDAYKAVNVLVIVLAGLMMYVWARSYWGPAGGTIAAALYVWAPYLLHNLYLRGAWGEITVRAFVPGALWAVDRLIRTGKLRYIFLTASLTGLSVLAHHYTGLWTVGLVGIYGTVIALIFRRTKLLPFALAAGLWAGALSVFYWLPLLAEFRHALSGIDAEDLASGLNIREANGGYLSWENLLPFSWAMRNTGEGKIIGIVQFVAAVMAGIVAIRDASFRHRERTVLLFCLGLGTALALITTRLGTPLWNVTGTQLIDVPYRVLGLGAMFLAFGAGAIAKTGTSRMVAVLFVAAALITGWPYAQPGSLLAVNTQSYVLQPVVPDDRRVEAQTPGMLVSELATGYTSYAFVADSSSRGNVRIMSNYFPGWQVRVDGRPVPFVARQGSNIVVDVPAGKHRVEADFHDTPVRRVATLISAGAWVLLLGGGMVCLAIAALRKRKHLLGAGAFAGYDA